MFEQTLHFVLFFLLPFSTSKQIFIVVLIVFQGRYPRSITIQPISQLQWIDDTKMASENLIIFFSGKQQTALKTDQKIYSRLIYDFMYNFFLSKDFQSSYITFVIFNNSTFFDTTKNK